MQSITDIVNEKVDALVTDGTIVEVIEQSVEKAITKALENQFESYGAITKQISEALNDTLKIDMSQLPIQSYNEQMAVAVKARLGEFFKDTASNKFMESIDAVLAPAPKTMHIKEFIETVVGYWKTDEPWDADDLDANATVEIIDRESISGTQGCSLNMWKQRQYASSISSMSRDNIPDLQLYIINGQIRISHKQSYNPTCFNEHECFVFKLYAAGTELLGIDGFDAESECDLTLKDGDY